jgi:hypothetical protein
MNTRQGYGGNSQLLTILIVNMLMPEKITTKGFDYCPSLLLLARSFEKRMINGCRSMTSFLEQRSATG